MNFKITSLRLKDCGPFNDVFIDFTDESGQPLDICLIAGPNGSGKTTVLQIIVELFGLLQLDQNRKYNFGNISGYKELNLLIDGEKLSLYKGKATQDYGAFLRNLESNYLGYEPKEESVYSKRRSNGDLVKRIYDLIQIEQKKEISFLKWSILEEKKLSTMLFFPHRRSLDKLSNRTQIHKEPTKFQLVYQYESATRFKGSLESYLVWIEYTEPDIFQSIIEFLNEMDIDGKTFYIERKELMIMVKTQNGVTHPLSKLSAGEQNMLVILIAIRRRLDRSGIILIDEADNSLHPEYQLKLLHVLKKLQKETNSQLFITSHSIDIYDDITDYNPIRNSAMIDNGHKRSTRREVRLLNQLELV